LAERESKQLADQKEESRMSQTSYDKFLANKVVEDVPSGMEEMPELSEHLFPFQKAIVEWALRRGRAAIFADCGLGKGLMQLQWAQSVSDFTGKPVLIIAPLAVVSQTVREGVKFGFKVNACRSDGDVVEGINISNYEMLHHFDPDMFGGVVLDESSAIKSFTGAIRNQIIQYFGRTPFRLACTATPAPNDFMELGNHSEFLGVMSRSEMLAMFFVHDGGSTSQWRLKGHAQDLFWKWIASWAVCIRKPSDIGFEDDGYDLPPLTFEEHIMMSPPPPGQLFALEAKTLDECRKAAKASEPARVKACAELVNNSDEPWIIWCNRNSEGDALAAAIPDAVQVSGSDSPEHKVKSVIDFAEGKIRVLISKSRISGYGMNWQHCRNVAFVSVSHSFEDYYQSVRRCWRFGQQKDVNVHLFTSTAEGAVVKNVKRKERDAARLADGMVKHMETYMKKAISGTERQAAEYKRMKVEKEKYTAVLGDCVDAMREMEADSMHYSIFSPPFANLYVYSNSERDMGNCSDHKEFSKHFKFCVEELYRILKPGRLVSFHCMNLPTAKSRGEEIGLADFRGLLIRMFIKAGFIYHSEVVIWKDPVTAMQRTKALGLLHKQIKKDSCMSRQGIPDYLVTMRKPGDNPERVTHTNESFPVDLWQQYASPVWMDINPSNTLTREAAREEADEKHLCCLQLQVIERAIRLWTNPGDIVFSPFMGVGSEGYVALREGRRFYGVELKESYFKQARLNLKAAAKSQAQIKLFDLEGAVS
jgi:DNA modification methylase